MGLGNQVVKIDEPYNTISLSCLRIDSVAIMWLLQAQHKSI